MGTVYKAVDELTSALVALKVIQADASADRFLREGSMLSDVRHPSIVRYIAHGRTSEGLPYLAMEWLEGEDLGERLMRGALAPRDAVALAARIARGLGAIHAAGIVHRDIKPANVFLEGGDPRAAKILDLGVARPPPDATRLTRTGAIAGTAGYMAPEQARGLSDPDARADVFALGCVLFECLCGRRAFTGEHALAVLARVLLEEPPIPSQLAPGLPHELDELVLRLLSKDPDRRPQNGEAAAEELERIAKLPLGLGPMSSNVPLSMRAITEIEQRIVSVVVAQAVAATAVSTEEDDAERGLAELSRLRGARVETLADGSVLVVFSGTGAPTDRAVMAAHAALRMRDLFEGVPIAIATGRVVLTSTSDRSMSLLGDAIERAANRSGSRARVTLDETTAALLDDRFEVRVVGTERELVGARSSDVGARKLLGKPTPCVGRERELALLAGLLEESAQEHVARCALVVGPPGIGKSRVRFELLRRAERLDPAPTVFFARADAVAKSAPFGLVGQALRRAAGVFDGEPALLQRAKLSAFVARSFQGEDRQRITEFLAEVIGAPFDASDASQLFTAARSDTQLMGDQIRLAFEDLIAAEAANKPVLFVLEDLHWGDWPTVHLIDAALRKLSDRPLFVVAFARPEVYSAFPKLWSARSMTEIGLTELSRRASERLVREVLGAAAPEGTVARLVEHAGGNAFYLEELIRAAASADDLERALLPGTVIAMVETRLDALEPDVRRTLRAASVFGKRFWRGALAVPLGSPNDASLDAWIEELETRELVEAQRTSRFSGEVEIVFRHALVREAAYAMLTEQDRVVSHRHAARWLERMGEGNARLLAEHYANGNEPKIAADLYVRAADQSMEGNDMEGVARSARTAIDLGAAGMTLGRALTLEAESARWRGDSAAAEARATAALQHLPTGSATWLGAMATKIVAVSRLGAYERLTTITDELYASGGAELAPHAYLAALARLLNALAHVGHERADEVARELRRVGEPLLESDAKSRALYHFSLGTLAQCRGEIGDALTLNTSAATAFREAGDRRNTSFALINVGCSCVEVGAYEQGERALREGIAAAKSLDLPVLVAATESNLGQALTRLGRAEEARGALEAAIRTFVAGQDRRGEGATQAYLGAALTDLGHLTGARAALARAVFLLDVAPPMLALALTLQGELELSQNNPRAALAATSAAMEHLRALGGVEEGESRLRLAHARALEATGDAAGARAAILEAAARLTERAAKISDDFRETFLTAVPENRETMARARALQASASE
jgi:tetratricopeptide (TPR) repeat protein